jgi:ribonuclease HII
MQKKKKRLKKKTILKKIIPKRKYEETYWQKGFKRIAGIDEVGRGAWAGPLVAAAVIIPKNQKLYLLRDSKLLGREDREKLSRKINKLCQVGIGSVSPAKINRLGLTQSTKLAYQKAIEKLPQKPDLLLIDAFEIDYQNIKSIGIIHGDQICSSIAAASIVAKVYRDRLMRKIAKRFRKWDFNNNKGYGTKKHQEALKKHGVTKVHRLNYKPIKKIVNSVN